jgi:hypothetical protein
MLCTCHDAPYLGTHHQKTALAAWSIIATLLALCDAWREALAAHRQYEHLRSRGVSHDAAILAPAYATRQSCSTSRVRHDPNKA